MAVNRTENYVSENDEFTTDAINTGNSQIWVSDGQGGYTSVGLISAVVDDEEITLDEAITLLSDKAAKGANPGKKATTKKASVKKSPKKTTRAK